MSYARATSRAIAGQLRKLNAEVKGTLRRCFSWDGIPADYDHLVSVLSTFQSTLRLARRHAREVQAMKGP